MGTTVDLIKKIEREAYPDQYRGMQDCYTMDDIAYYAEAEDEDDLIILTGEHFYFIAVKSTREIVDLAGRMSLKDMHSVKRTIRRNFKGRAVALDARHSTSYRIIKFIGDILEDVPYDWCGETFHEMKVLIK